MAASLVELTDARRASIAPREPCSGARSTYEARGFAQRSSLAGRRGRTGHVDSDQRAQPEERPGFPGASHGARAGGRDHHHREDLARRTHAHLRPPRRPSLGGRLGGLAGAPVGPLRSHPWLLILTSGRDLDFSHPCLSRMGETGHLHDRSHCDAQTGSSPLPRSSRMHPPTSDARSSICKSRASANAFRSKPAHRPRADCTKARWSSESYWRRSTSSPSSTNALRGLLW